MAVLFEGASDSTDWVGAGAMGAVVRAGMSNESLKRLVLCLEVRVLSHKKER